MKDLIFTLMEHCIDFQLDGNSLEHAVCIYPFISQMRMNVLKKKISITTVDILEVEDGLYERLQTLGLRLQEGLKLGAEKNGHDGPGQMTHLAFTACKNKQRSSESFVYCKT